MSDTIAAISTGSCVSAIGIVRLSGDGAIEIVRRMFFPSSGKPMDAAKDRQLVYGEQSAAQLHGREHGGASLPRLAHGAQSGARCGV